MLIDESANLFVRVARLGRGLKRLVDLIPDLLAHRVGGGKPLIVAAGVQRRGNIEKRFAVLQADVGAGRVHQSRGFRREQGLPAGLEGGSLSASAWQTTEDLASAKDAVENPGRDVRTACHDTA